MTVDELKNLDLEGVSVVAAVDPSDGSLLPVGGLWEKLGQQAMDLAHRRLLHTVVVAVGQEGMPPEYLGENAKPLRVLQAVSVADAVRQILEQSLPRRAVRQYEKKVSESLDIFRRLVSMETYYQVLPLLQEVPQARLPRERRSDDGEKDTTSRLRMVDITRWEEEIREKHVTYKQHSLEEVFANSWRVAAKADSTVPRFVVLGPPGCGKTTLEQYLAWRVARGTLRVLGRQLVPAQIRLREWEAWALKEREPNFSLADYLTERYRQTGIEHTPTSAQWQRWLVRGEVILFLDGLDEVRGDQSFLVALQTALVTFTDCPTVLTCRTVSFEQHGVLCPDLPVFTLAGFDRAQRDAYIHAFPANHRDSYDPEALIDQLNRTPQMHPLTANPLLLSIICSTVDDSHGAALPVTRSALYDKAVERLLQYPRRVRVTYPNGQTDIPAIRKRRILERTAFTLFTDRGPQRQLTFDEASLVNVLTRAAEQEGYRADPAPIADALLVDLTANSGIIRGDANQGYFFLHLTVQEFLSAALLARLVNETKGEERWLSLPPSDVEIGGNMVTVDHLIKQQALDAGWQEIIVLLAGMLSHPKPLLVWLATPRRKDVFGHRLALAALCLPEIKPAIRNDNQLYRIMSYITSAVVALWYTYELGIRDGDFSHLTRALPSLGQVNAQTTCMDFVGSKDSYFELCEKWRNVRLGQVDEERDSLLEFLCKNLFYSSDDSYCVPEYAAEALGLIGETAAQHPEVLSALVQALRPEENVSLFAADALGLMGETAAQHPEVLPALVEAALREDDGWELPRHAQEALEKMIETAARHPEVVSAVVQALYHTDEYIRGTALGLLGLMSEAGAQHPEVLPALMEVALRDTDKYLRNYAGHVLEGLTSQGVRISEEGHK